MHDMHKLAVDMPFIQMTPKKGFKKHGEREVAVMYKECTKFTRNEGNGGTGTRKPHKII